MKRANLIGQRFGRLVVAAQAPNRGAKTQWLCDCDCGERTTVGTSNLTCGKTLSCGCLATEVRAARAIERNDRHGHNTRAAQSPTYNSWHSMLARCTRPTHRSYSDYGGRGITVCTRWREDFRHFLADMGERPDGTTLDRIDVNRGYEPDNCRWATRSEQQRNKRCHAR